MKKYCAHCQQLVGVTRRLYYKNGKLIRIEYVCDECLKVVLIHYEGVLEGVRNDM